MRGDMVKADRNIGFNERQIMEGTIYPDNSLCDWTEFYKVINYCNEVIYYAPGVQDRDKTFTEYLLNGYLSEAYFLRSLSYFYLVRIFKEVPLVLVPTISDGSELYPEKKSETEILTQIKEDLNMAYQWATVDGYLSIIDNKGRATKPAFDALLADIALWEFDYETAVTHCNNIISFNKYEIVPGQNWFSLFYPGNTLESIFEFQLDNFTNNQKNHTYDITNYNAYNYDPSDYAIEIFDPVETENRDIARGLGLSIKEQAEDDYIIWKYVGMIGDNQTSRMGSELNSANWIVYRLSDIYLMRAEALSQLGRYNEALNSIMEVRIERSLGYPSNLLNTPNSFEDIIIEERARELAFEGKRWFDLMRMGRRNDYSRKSDLISVMVKNVPSTQKRILQTKLTNPLSWYLPIWETELERNKKLEQNPYYNF
jgi:tetratricopeptide (TPR) repeat protein